MQVMKRAAAHARPGVRLQRRAAALCFAWGARIPGVVLRPPGAIGLVWQHVVWVFVSWSGPKVSWPALFIIIPLYKVRECTQLLRSLRLL